MSTDNKNKVICIEGDVAAGKTSICEALTDMIDNAVFADAGNIARAIIQAAKTNPHGWVAIIKILLGKKIDAVKLMKQLKVTFKIENKKTVIYIKDKKINEAKLQSRSNSKNVSKYTKRANTEELYAFARKMIDDLKNTNNVIVSGRDLVRIYPNLDAHVYITASIESRVKRRYHQYGGRYSKEELKKEIEARDKMHEEAGYNNTCDKTIKVDVTDCKTVEESAKKVLKELQQKINFDIGE